MHDDDHALLQQIKTDLYGKDGRNGIRGRQDRMFRDMYHNPETGEPGLVADVRAIRRIVDKAVSLFEVMTWIAGLGVGALLLRWIYGLFSLTTT